MPIVTISRGSFSQGKAVAEHLAAKLNWPLLSREEIVAQAAADYGIAADDLAATLNQPPPFWQQVHNKRIAYVKCVTAALVDRARSGNLVYHGCVGHLLLAGIAHVLRVRVIAELEFRIHAAMRDAGFTREQAIAHIQRVDKERARWARLLYGVEWDDPLQYDLILNVGRIPVAAACEIISASARLPDFQPTAQSLKQMEDLSLSCRVWAAIARNPDTRGAGLRVTADAGNVVIAGSVGSQKTADTVTRIASAVEGVRTLRSEAGVGADWQW